ncbi:MAG: hypothetical protein ABI456_05380 [Ktedonobacteraceae bacterium]
MQEPHEPRASLEGGSHSDARRADYWARWEYTAEEWHLYDRLDWGAAKRTFLLWSSAILLINVLFFVYCILFLGMTTQLQILFFPGMLLLVSVGIFASSGGRALREARRRHSARLNGPKRITIGNRNYSDQAIWQGGLYIPLQALFLTLVSVKMKPNPPQLWLRRKHHENSQFFWFDTIHVLVPPGHEEEAHHLLERFHRETIGAKTRISTPAEPR